MITNVCNARTKYFRLATEILWALSREIQLKYLYLSWTTSYNKLFYVYNQTTNTQQKSDCVFWSLQYWMFCYNIVVLRIQAKQLDQDLLFAMERNLKADCGCGGDNDGRCVIATKTIAYLCWMWWHILVPIKVVNTLYINLKCV